jgi:hypothetical protein
VSAFRELTTACERLKESSAAMMEHSRQLAKPLGERDREADQTHRVILDRLGALITQGQSEQEQIEQASQKSSATLERYKRVLIQSASAQATEIESSQTEMGTFGAELSQGLYEQRENLSGLDTIEHEADVTRVAQLTNYAEVLRQVDDQAIAILDALSQTDEALGRSLQTEAQLEIERQTQAALDLNRQAIMAYDQGYRQQAAALLEKAARLVSRNQTIQLNLARLCVELQRIEQARQIWQDAAHLWSDSIGVLYLEGLIALKEHDYACSIDILARCVDEASSPADGVTYRLALAEAYYRAERPQLASEQWKRVLEIEPLQPVATTWLQAIE